MVRQLSGSDVVLLKQLLNVFGEAFEDVATYQGAVPGDDYLRSLLQRPHIIVLVAMNGNEIIGGLVAYELDKFEQDRREIRRERPTIPPPPRLRWTHRSAVAKVGRSAPFETRNSALH